MSDGLIEELERWQETQGLKNVQVANLLGLKKPQNYTNWLARRSVPKPYITAVIAVLGSPSPKEARIAVKRLAKNPQLTAAHYVSDEASTYESTRRIVKSEQSGLDWWAYLQELSEELSTEDCARAASLFSHRVQKDLESRKP